MMATNKDTAPFDWQTFKTFATQCSQEQSEILQLTTRLQEWFNRFDFYTTYLSTLSEIDYKKRSYTQKICHWKEKHKLKQQAKQLQAAMSAYRELTNNTHQFRKEALLGFMDKKILEMEIKQLYMLRKYNEFSRGLNNQSLEDLNEQLKIARDENKKNMQNIPSHDLINKTAKPNAFTFFYHYQHKKYLKQLLITAHVVNKASYLTALSSAIRGLMIHIHKFSSNVLHGLQAIPIINTIVSAIPVIVQAVTPWIKNESPNKKKRGGILGGLLIGGIVLFGLSLGGISVVSMGCLAAILTFIGAWVCSLHPWLKQYHKMIQQRREADQVATALTERKEKATRALSPIEQEYLLIKLEEAYAKKPLSLSSEDMMKHIRTIRSGNYNAISAISAPLGLHSPQQPIELSQLLTTALETHQTNLTEELRNLKKPYIVSSINAGNNLLTIIGAILIAIPTPPTLIIGLTLLLTSAFIGLTITFEWPQKIIKWFSKKETYTITEGQATSSTSSPQNQEKHPFSKKHTPSNDPLIQNHFTKRRASSSPPPDSNKPSSQPHNPLK